MTSVPILLPFGTQVIEDVISDLRFLEAVLDGFPNLDLFSGEGRFGD